MTLWNVLVKPEAIVLVHAPSEDEAKARAERWARGLLEPSATVDRVETDAFESEYVDDPKTI